MNPVEVLLLSCLVPALVWVADRLLPSEAKPGPGGFQFMACRYRYLIACLGSLAVVAAWHLLSRRAPLIGLEDAPLIAAVVAASSPAARNALAALKRLRPGS